MKINRIAAALPLLFSGFLHSAAYQVVEIPTEQLGPLSSSNAIDPQGRVAVGVSASFSGDVQVIPLYNLPIDVTLLDFESESLTNSLTDPDAARQGDFNADDLLILSLLVGSTDLRTSLFTQKLSYQEAYIYQNGTLDAAPVFDVFSEELDSFTRSIDTSILAFNDQGDYVGVSQSPFSKLEYIDEAGNVLTYMINDFSTLGYASINGVNVPLTPVASTLGGVSRASDINTQLQVVGTGSVEFSDGFITSVENCEDEESRGDQPIEACQQSLRNIIAGSVRERATVWQLDSDGDIVDTQTLGILFEPDANDETFYTSVARAINNNGIIVGDSNIIVDSGETLTSHAAVFDNGNVNGFVDTEEYIGSTATDINDQNFITGQSVTFINGFRRTKFFIHDYSSGETVYPNDFFLGSSSLARAINNQNQIVGSGDIDASLTDSALRRKEAFLYNHNNATFTNLNDLIPCDSPYLLVDATDINDSGEIAADAVVSKPRRNVLGEIELDSDTGDQILEDTVVAVKLIPTNGEPEDCSALVPTFERSGGGIAYLLILPLCIIGTRVRRAFVG